jgi:L-aspartate oxidase
MHKYHHDAELAPRDIVSRAILSQIVETSSTHVYLDMTHLDREFVRNRFPRIYATCLKYGLDITTVRIPVSPAAHYIMGGVKTDLDGRSSIPGLFAAGEVACTGVHGANRLASNSLLEGLVYGFRAARAAADYGAKAGDTMAASRILNTALYSPEASLNICDLKKMIDITMWDRTGIIRCAESLNTAKQGFLELKELLGINFDSRQGVELRNMLTVAIIITEAALLREGSIGAHCRSDFPARGNAWQLHTNIIKSGNEVKTAWT